MKDLKVFKERQVRLVRLVRQGHVDKQALPVRLELLDPLETLVLRDLQDLKVCKDYKAFKVRQVLLD
jgi:hypothetical protein